MTDKTSKVKKVVNVKLYNGANGTIYYHDLIMENGDKLNIGKKKQLQTGWEISYNIIGDQKDDGTYQQEYPKAKSIQPQNGTYNTRSKSTNSVASFALSYAKDMAVAHINNGQKIDAKQVTQVASVFNQWLKDNS